MQEDAPRSESKERAERRPNRRRVNDADTVPCSTVSPAVVENVSQQTLAPVGIAIILRYRPPKRGVVAWFRMSRFVAGETRMEPSIPSAPAAL